MPAKILQNRKVEGGAQHAGPRNFYISWVQAAPGGDRHGPPACAGLFRLKLSALQEDLRKRPIRSVVASAPGQQQAGALVVSGGDSHRVLAGLRRGRGDRLLRELRGRFAAEQPGRQCHRGATE
mgnify:CR=1 FL=1